MATLPKNPVEWVDNRQQGSLGISSGANLLTQSGIDLLTQAGVALTINGNTVTFPQPTAWTATVKQNTAWLQPQNGNLVVTGQQQITDNLGNFLTDNLGNFIVTSGQYMAPKNATVWTETAAR